MYLHTKLQKPASNSSFVIVMQSNVKFRFNAAAVMLFHILQKISATKAVYFSNICYQISFPDPTLSSASIAPPLSSWCFRHVVNIYYRK